MALISESQKALSDRQDMKLAVDGMRAVFMENGVTHPRHQKALDALARFCRINAYDYKTDQVQILRMTGRLEVYNYIMFCLRYPDKERHKLKAQIQQLEETADGSGRRSADDD